MDEGAPSSTWLKSLLVGVSLENRQFLAALDMIIDEICRVVGESPTTFI